MLAMEIVLQPHVAPTSGGGGGSNDDRGWNDEDKDKNVYKTQEKEIDMAKKFKL